MPGVGLDARQYPAKRTEKPEPRRIGLQPFGKWRIWAARRELLRRQLYPVARRGGMTIDEINIGAPVVSTRAGESGPRQNSLDALKWRQSTRVERQARCVDHRPLTA